jgi:hypothetical protein
MAKYCAFGLNIQSDIELPALLPAVVERHDVLITTGPVSHEGLKNPSTVKPFSQLADNEVWLHVPDVARFYISGGQKIDVEPETGADPQTVRLFLLGSCMGAILHQRNQLVIHGNAIRFGDHCVIFAGASGNGKSTLAAAFHRRGHEVLADDLAVVDEQLRVQPGYPQMKLWRDSAEKLGIDVAGLTKIRYQLEKYAYPIKQGFCASPLPIKMLCLLNTHHRDELLIEPITGMDKFTPLKFNTYREGYLEGLGLKGTHLQRCAQLADKIRVCRITRPEEGFQLDRLLDRIEQELSENALL